LGQPIPAKPFKTSANRKTAREDERGGLSEGEKKEREWRKITRKGNNALSRTGGCQKRTDEGGPLRLRRKRKRHGQSNCKSLSKRKGGPRKLEEVGTGEKSFLWGGKGRRMNSKRGGGVTGSQNPYGYTVREEFR